MPSYFMKKTFVTGKISINSKGMGFVTPETVTDKNKDQDILVEVQNLNTAMHGDLVEVAILPNKLYNKTQGEITKIIKRAKMQFVGVIGIHDSVVYLTPDDRRFYADIVLPKESVKDAKINQKALVEIVDWQKGKNPEGKILEVIGPKGEHETEINSIILEKGFHAGFPPEVEAEADKFAREAFPVAPEEVARRRDFRNTLTFTIDPKDAKDFDDALSFKKLENGNYEIGVHIADVSHYVRPGTELDKEAIKRGCSIYLVDRTIPMLPHALSNDICSLNPNVDRLAFGAVFEIDSKGNIHNRWFGKTIIHSARRYNYEEAQEIMDKKSGDYFDVLITMNEIAKIYIKENTEAGAINFETTEIKFELDEKGVPLRVIKKERVDTHKMIEQYMLLANKEVAKFIYDHDKKIISKSEGLMYRVHNAPDPQKVKDLALLIRTLGYHFNLDKDGNIRAGDLNKLFKEIEGKPEETLIKTAAVRSMSKAIYSTLNTGHFGLAFEYYTHFTSPIRRYPDLLVHRILETYIQGKKLSNNDVAFFAEAAESSTEREISASDAERSSIKYKQVEYWAPRVGAELTGVISGVTEWGMYIEETETKAEGMIRLKDLTATFGEMFTFEEKAYSIVSQSKKHKFTLGDTVKVKLLRADVERKTLDFELVK